MRQDSTSLSQGPRITADHISGKSRSSMLLLHDVLHDVQVPGSMYLIRLPALTRVSGRVAVTSQPSQSSQLRSGEKVHRNTGEVSHWRSLPAASRI